MAIVLRGCSIGPFYVRVIRESGETCPQIEDGEK